MIFEIQNESDIVKLELFCLSFVGSERLDSSILRSHSFLELKNCILRRLEKNMTLPLELPYTFYFCDQNLIITIIHLKPILVYVGSKHVDINLPVNHI